MSGAGRGSLRSGTDGGTLVASGGMSDSLQAQSLADEVRAELAAAGLPVLPPLHYLQPERASGVSVEVEDDRVWVSWEISGPLSDASRRAFEVGAYRHDSPDGSFDGHPAMRHWGTVKSALRDALTAILRSLDYGVRGGRG